MFVVFVMFLVSLLMVLAAMFAFRRLRACHERRKAFKQLVEILSARQQSFNLYADLCTLVGCLIKGIIIA